jgi:hypothetical protein
MEIRYLNAQGRIEKVASSKQNNAGCKKHQFVVLFVEPDSIYKRLGLDCYDKERDATTYTGTAPVIAHPPCQLWGAMALVNYARWGGEHNRPGNDGGLFRFALDTVRRCSKHNNLIEHANNQSLARAR